MSKMSPALIVLSATTVALVGCTSATTPPIVDETYVSGPTTTPEPGAPPTFGPIEADTTVVVRATATDAAGAALQLEMQVHSSISYDDIGGQTLPKAMAEDCAGTLNADIFAQQLWSFTRINVVAVPDSSGGWPTDSRIAVAPSATSAAIVARGVMMNDQATPETPLCLTEKYFAGSGQANMAMGIAQDSGVFTKWLGHRYGFTAPGVTFSDCSFEVTALGDSLGANAAGWIQLVDANNCSIGAAVETKEY